MSVQLEVKERAIRPRSLKISYVTKESTCHCLRLPN